jgi:hypothetical protein
VVASPTRTGALWFVVVPSPSWPLRLLPQHHSVPSVWTPQVKLVPAVMLAQVVASPIRTGVLRFVVVPSPSWPLKLLPQHHSVPSVPTAQVCA